MRDKNENYGWKDSNIVTLLHKCSHLPMFYDVDGCIVSDAVVHATTNVPQALLLFVNVMRLQLINSLLDDTPYVVVNQTEVWAVS